MGHYIEERRDQIREIDKKARVFLRQRVEQVTYGSLQVILKDSEAKIMRDLDYDQNLLDKFFQIASNSISHEVALERCEILWRTLKSFIELPKFIEQKISFSSSTLYPPPRQSRLSSAFRNYPGIFNQALEEGIKQGNQKFLNCIETPDVPLLPFKKQIMSVVMSMEETLEGNFQGLLPTALSGVDLYYLYFPYSDDPELRLVIQPPY